MTWWGGLKKIRWESLKFKAWCSTSFKYKCSEIRCLLLLFLRSLTLCCNGSPCVVQDTLDNFLSQFKNYDRGKSKVLIWEFCVLFTVFWKLSISNGLDIWKFHFPVISYQPLFFCLLLFIMQSTKKQSNETEVEVRFLLSEPHFYLRIRCLFKFKIISVF